MVTVSIADHVATFELQGVDRLWGLRRRIRVPVAHIVDVRRAPPLDLTWRDLRLLGTYFKGRLVAGLFRKRGRFVFYDVRSVDRSIAIELTHQFYDDLVLEVEDPDRVIRDLEEARRQTLKRK
jgi:hypothetical protein